MGRGDSSTILDAPSLAWKNLTILVGSEFFGDGGCCGGLFVGDSVLAPPPYPPKKRIRGKQQSSSAKAGGEMVVRSEKHGRARKQAGSMEFLRCSVSSSTGVDLCCGSILPAQSHELTYQCCRLPSNPPSKVRLPP